MNNPQIISKTILFHGMSEEELEAALQSLQAEEKDYRKGQLILHAGKRTDRMGLVLEGSVSIESNDFWGNRTILSHVEAGQVFAETYALLQSESMLVDAVANDTCRILFLDIRGLLKTNALEGWQADYLGPEKLSSVWSELSYSAKIDPRTGDGLSEYGCIAEKEDLVRDPF